MAALEFHPPHDAILNFLLEKATPEEILAYQVSEEEQQRTIDLLDKQDEGTLSADEAAELDFIRRMDLLLQALQAKALMALQNRK
jgi:hypothetical protein